MRFFKMEMEAVDSSYSDRYVTDMSPLPPLDMSGSVRKITIHLPPMSCIVI